MKNKFSIILVSALLIACGSPDKKAQLEKLKSQKADLETKISALEEELAKSDTTKQKLVDVTTSPLTTQTFKTYIEVQGRIDADENVTLSTEMPGTVTKINVKVGDEVSKGQILAETDARAVQQQIVDLQTNLELATQVYQKQKNLWDQKIGTEIQYLQAKNTKESLEHKIATLQEQVRMSKIISPINGTIDAVNIKIGQAVAPGFPAINVINFSNLKIKADVSESYASRVKTGDEVLVLFPDIKDTLSSKIKYAARAINNLTRTFLVEVLLDNKKEYHPNMVAKLKINDYQSPSPKVVIPVKYIQKGTNNHFVMIMEKGVAVKKTITISREYNGNAEIAEGVNEGDLLITEGYDLINEGDHVNPSK
ncbi:MAG: efflux RND transporter periplasmic adaptor subunit [Bacteroidia bacterium]|nr:efflux RND transporter periplasmic adaptor subunit [Bacteroidia bacterium]